MKIRITFDLSPSARAAIETYYAGSSGKLADRARCEAWIRSTITSTLVDLRHEHEKQRADRVIGGTDRDYEDGP